MVIVATDAEDRISYLSLCWCGGSVEKNFDIDISAGNNCSTGWIKRSFNGVSFCRATSDSTGCYSTFFSIN